jgi:hypothetical protein
MAAFLFLKNHLREVTCRNENCLIALTFEGVLSTRIRRPKGVGQFR